MVSLDDVRTLASHLPRSYEVLVRDRVKFRVGTYVYLSFSRDETIMGFAFPKEEREGLVASEPAKFSMPSASDMRYNWVHVRLAMLGAREMREIVLEAWRMVVPKSVAASVDERALLSGRATRRSGADSARTSAPVAPSSSSSRKRRPLRSVRDRGDS